MKMPNWFKEVTEDLWGRESVYNCNTCHRHHQLYTHWTWMFYCFMHFMWPHFWRRGCGAGSHMRIHFSSAVCFKSITVAWALVFSVSTSMFWNLFRSELLVSSSSSFLRGPPAGQCHLLPSELLQYLERSVTEDVEHYYIQTDGKTIHSFRMIQ